MRIHKLKAILKAAVSGAAVLLLGVGLASPETVNVTAGPSPMGVKLPDGSPVPMWGYSCDATQTSTIVSCSALNTHAAAGAWSPIAITVPTGTPLTIHLTNNLVFNGNLVPTSMVIVGQLGGGLGDVSKRTTTPSPSHDNQGTTWPIANSGPVFTPPQQGPRVQSFGTEIAGNASGDLTWTDLKPGTYLLESGTHPSIQATMGLIGVVVVTTAPTASADGTAYPAVGTKAAVTYKADLPLLFSEIDPVQNTAVDAAVKATGFSESATRGVVVNGPVSSISLTSGGSGYTSVPTVNFTTPAGSTAATATAVVDTDPTSPTYQQVTGINIVYAGNYAVAPKITLSGGGGAGAAAISALQLQPNGAGQCSGGAAACYPSVVNYTPLYYLINGAAFDRTNSASSVFAAANSATSTVSGNVLVRIVNAGSRMHVPSIVGSLTTNAAKTVSGFTLVAEDGNSLPGAPRVQSEVFMAAGKTYDVIIDTPAAGGTALPIFDRELSLSANAISRDAGMLAYISVNGSGVPSAASGTATAVADTYNAVVPGKTLAISDPAMGVIANDSNIFGVQVITGPSHGTLTLNANGTFSYVPDGSWPTSPQTPAFQDTFHYCGNGALSGAACTDVTLSPSNIVDSAGITLCSVATACTYMSNVATALTVKAPGVLDGATDGANLALSVKAATLVNGNLAVIVNKDGSFTASASAPGTYSFDFTAQNSVGMTKTATVQITFPNGSGLNVTVLDGADKQTTIPGYRWIIEEDRTFFSDPNCTGNPPQAGCPGSASGVVPNFGTNFHTSYMPVIATGCTDGVSCGNNQTAGGNPVQAKPISKPGDVALCTTNLTTRCLDPNKRYYISVLPGDAAQPFIAGYASAPTNCSTTGGADGTCGHGMGGAPIAKGTHDGSQSITVMTEPSPYPPATLSVFVFEDDYPLNGEHDAGGGVDVLSPNEAGLGGFQITLQDNAGGTGDATGTPTYDMFNMPLSNSLAGTLDPVTHLDACPLSVQDTQKSESGDGSQNGIVGMIITCPTFESDHKTLSPLAGQAIVKNLYPGRYGVTANAGADRIARGEEWVQTNTLDGQKAHDSFMRIGEPGYFQEFGPAGYHVTIGFANPKIINDRGAAICSGANSDCTHEVTGHITTARMSRTPDERLYGSGTHDSYSFTQCYVSLGDPDGADFMFTKCDADGNFDFKGVPPGNWKITTFDQWNDQVVDGITTPVGMCDPQSSLSPNPVTNCKPLVKMGEVAVHQWQANIYTRTFLDTDYSGLSTDQKPGLALVDTNIRFRDGSYSNFNSTDLDGYAGFNEVFPLFNWYVIETDSTRYKNSGTHVVYDSGGPVDNPTDPTAPTGLNCSGSGSASKPCETTGIAANLANTYEPNPLPSDLSVPGSVYCTLAVTADCTGESIATSLQKSDSTTAMSTGRIDPGWVNSYGWQGYSGQNNFLEFGKRPFANGENGGIHGHVVYASTRPFDDPQLLLQTSWEPLVPHVRIKLYKEGLASDGVTATLTLVDHTETTSFDDWAQGFRKDGNGALLKDSSGNYIPNMNCPGQGTDTSTMPDPYYWFALKNQPQWLDLYNSDGTTANPVHPIAHNAQFKCYDGMHNWNQLQPAPYDGMYSFPSVTAMDPVTGKPTATNCTACIANPTKATGVADTDPKYDPYRAGTPMLPDGKYVVEVVVPEGYELVKEEDKNILIGDNFIAPVTQQFGGLASIFILPDQATISSSNNPNNPQNSTNDLGRTTLPSHEADTGSVETYWPCVGAEHVVPDYISLFPGSGEVAPFAGATRHLCDRKEVQLDDQTAALAKFYIFTETHTASHFTGVITDDFTAEFDPFSPQFGEKFGPAYLPVSFKDWAGNEIDRVYTDAWGAYNGLSYSTWEVNPPNPTGYGPTMMVGCMNDAGPVSDGKGGTMNDPLFQDGYSQFCYELPFMPGQTGYFDTPVVPTSAFAGGYNNPDCAYPDATPAISEVDGDTPAGVAGGMGPWVQTAGHILAIKALGDQLVDNFQYSGPSAIGAPFNQQKVTRHYNFGAAPTDFTKFSALPAGQTYSCSSPTNSAPTVCPYVTIGGKAMTGVIWTPTSITGAVPTGVAPCAVQQQAQFGGSTALCGELSITAANGQQSVDTVTVTIGGKKPTVITDKTPLTVSSFGAIQTAIDNTQPGDLIIVGPGVHSEMLLMWKPVRLQGVGAASTIIDANPHPAGKLNPWRQRVVCLFGLALDGTPISATHPYDPSNPASTGCPSNMKFSVDRLPLEATVGWDATLNGNLAEQLIEPTLMGAYEGAGITVLGKGVRFPANPTNDPTLQPFAADTFPTGTQLLDGSTAPLSGRGSDPNGCGPNGTSLTNPNPSNFLCNPSSIDGLTIQNSSQGGGAIWVHAWGHKLQIANNRLLNNQGTMSGGITVGQGEHPDAYLAGGAAANTIPGSCLSDTGVTNNLALPYCNNLDVNVHHNSVTQNSSLGDELFSSTPAGAGGVTFCNGSDYYKFNYNWVCGNMSTGDGAGVAHVGLSYDGDIEHNSILYNQSTNPTIVTNGAGLLVMGAPDADPPCGLTTDQDCVPTAAQGGAGSILPSDGTGPGLVINANLILGNSAESGSGGGLRLQHINGTDVLNFPKGNQHTNWPNIPGHPVQPDFQTRTPWNAIQVTNNIIANNVAGIDGGGVSLLDALATDIVNNTVVSNNSTATSGVLLQTLFAPLASTGAGGFNDNCAGGGQSCPQVAGLVSVTNSAVLVANMQQITPNGISSITCPSSHGTRGQASDCTKFSVPVLYNDLFWQNRSLVIGVGSSTSAFTNQQNTVTVYNANFAGPSTSTAASQTHTGICNDTAASYWDIGVRGDTAPGSAANGKLPAMYSLLTNSGEVAAGSTNVPGNASLTATYCNGARVPVEAAAAMPAGSTSPYPGWLAPPGTNESNALPAPPFTLLASATVDEGNNWINLRWGPLSMNLPNPVSGGALINAAPAAGSSAINEVPPMNLTQFNPYSAAPLIDFYGNPRKTVSDPKVDIGAIESQTVVIPPTISAVTATIGYRGQAVPVTITGTNLTGATVTVSGTGVTVGAVTVAANGNSLTTTFTIAAGASETARNVTVSVSGSSATLNNAFTVAGPTLTSISPTAGNRGTTLPVTLSGNGLAGTTTVAFSGTGTGNVITCSGVSATATTVTANCSIPATANLTTRTVSVTSPNGTSNTVNFSVTALAAPTLTSISPNRGVRSSTVSVTLIGSNLSGATAITVSGGTGNGVTVSGITVQSATSVTATFTISATATLSTRNVTITTQGGPSNAVQFTVGPAVTGVSPSSGVRGTSVPVTISGFGFTGATGATVSGAAGSVTVSNFSVVNDTTITATFTVAPSAGLGGGGRNVTVVNPIGSVTLNGAFTVANPPAPTLASITPAAGTHNTIVSVTAAGTNFTAAGTTVTVSGTGVTCTGVTVNAGGTSLTTSCAISNTAAHTARNFTVSNPGGTSGALSFTVN